MTAEIHARPFKSVRQVLKNSTGDVKNKMPLKWLRSLIDRSSTMFEYCSYFSYRYRINKPENMQTLKDDVNYTRYKCSCSCWGGTFKMFLCFYEIYTCDMGVVHKCSKDYPVATNCPKLLCETGRWLCYTRYLKVCGLFRVSDTFCALTELRGNRIQTSISWSPSPLRVQSI